MTTLPSIPRSYAAALTGRVVLFWAVLRGAAAFLLPVGASLMPVTRLWIAAIVLGLVALEGERRREALFHKNLGVHPFAPFAVGAATLVLLEAVAGIVMGLR